MRPIVRLSAALLLAAAGPHAVGADEIGTLFNTPEERARLDRLRRGEPVGAVQRDAPASRHRSVVTGYVQRSDGRNTVWIDGRPVVIASPGSRSVLEPGIVQPNPSERVLRVEEADKAER